MFLVLVSCLSGTRQFVSWEPEAEVSKKQACEQEMSPGDSQFAAEDPDGASPFQKLKAETWNLISL